MLKYVNEAQQIYEKLEDDDKAFINSIIAQQFWWYVALKRMRNLKDEKHEYKDN